MTKRNSPLEQSQATTLFLLKDVFTGKLNHFIYFKFLKTWNTNKKIIKKRSFFHWLLVEALELIFIILPVVLIFRHFIFQASFVPTPSMYPTLKVKDRLIVNRFIFQFTEPQRFDIIVFKSSNKFDNRQFVKRLVGLPGETLEIKRGIVYIDNKQLIFKGVNIQRDYSDLKPIKIPEGHYFVLGDNRPNSLDSRYWGFVKRTHVLGKAFFTFWPPQQIGVLN